MLNYLKIKMSQTAKDITEWKKIFAIYLSDKHLITRTVEKLNTNPN